jgi:flagellar biosynthetic protein FlhB
MAEESDQGEKTEEPTERRLEKAREEGQFLRSQDTSIAVLLISVAVLVYFFGSIAGENFLRLFNSALRFDSTLISTPGLVLGVLGDLFLRSLVIIAPLLVMTVFLTIVTAFFTGGIGFSIKAFLPKASKLNPLSGLGRMFGVRSLIELSKSLAKLLLISATIIGIVYFVNDQIFFLNLLPAKLAIRSGLDLLIWGILLVTLTLLLIAAIDLPYQIISFKNKLKMTRKELRDEFKETEGRPEVRARIRERQRQVAMNQMMHAISDADVIVTNPNHFAVALSYEPGGTKAPIVLAKGTDFIAATIRSKAADNTIPIFEAPYLARALYFTTDLNQEIPMPLYRAVAEVIAYVYQLAELRKDGSKPRKPEVKLPDSMLFDESGNMV